MDQAGSSTNKIEALAQEVDGADGGDEGQKKGAPVKAQISLKALKKRPKEDIVKEVSALRKDLRAMSDELLGMKGADAVGESFIDPIIWGGLFGLMFDQAAAWYGPHWALTKDEGALLGQAVDPVATKYLPEVMGQYKVECSAAAVLLQVVMTKWQAGPGKTNGKKPSDNGDGPEGRGEK